MPSGNESLPLLLLAASSRGMAMASASAGHTFISLDNYADADTAALSHRAIRLSPQDPEESLHRLKQAFPGQRYRVIAGGGLEADQDLMHLLSAQNDWCGARPDIRRELDDPVKLHGMLRSINIPTPYTSDTPPAAATKRTWLRKPRHSSGGIGIEKLHKNNIIKDNANVDNNYCWQEFLPGESYSATFLASRGEIHILGYSRHLRPEGHSFHYQGAVSVKPLPRWEEQLQQCLRPIMRESGLVGLAGVDFMAHHADRSHISIVEINPRPTASISLHHSPGTLMRLHLAACRGQLDQVPNYSEATGPSRGEMVHYSPTHMRVDISPAQWPAWVMDRPTPGSTFRPGDPVCTVRAHGANDGSVELELRRRIRLLPAIMRTKRWARDARLTAAKHGLDQWFPR